MQTYDRVGVPVFWIPGNYEGFQPYYAAFGHLADSLDNISNASKLGKYIFRKNGIEIDLVFVPGAKDFSNGFRVTDEAQTGYNVLDQTFTIMNKGVSSIIHKIDQIHVFNPHDLKELVTNPEGTVVFAHSPIKMNGDKTFDVSIHADYQGKEVLGPYAQQLIREGKAKPKIVHVGNELLARMVDEIGITKYFSGDIHEAVCTTDRRGNTILDGTFSRELFGNPGPAMYGRYGVLVYRDDGMAALYCKIVESK